MFLILSQIQQSIDKPSQLILQNLSSKVNSFNVEVPLFQPNAVERLNFTALHFHVAARRREERGERKERKAERELTF